jgi:hypothetical protein
MHRPEALHTNDKRVHDVLFSKNIKISLTFKCQSNCGLSDTAEQKI